MSKYVITYDIGTTGIKTCLIEIDKEMKILASATEGYGLYVDEETGVKGGSEQDADEWWNAMCVTTKEVFKKCKKIKKEQIGKQRGKCQYQDAGSITHRRREDEQDEVDFERRKYAASQLKAYRQYE